VRTARLPTPLAVSLIALAAVGAAGCPKQVDPRAVDPGLIAISPKLTVRTDKVGDAGALATFVLVDAENHADRELTVVLAGDLIDGSGAVVGHLRKDSLRVPPGGRRTFALVDNGVAARPAAVSARLRVDGASVPVGPSPIRIVDGHVYADQGRAVASGFVVNDAKYPGKAVVIAGFYDADGTPMTRPFDVYDIGPGARLPAQFVGPPGSKSAYIFVGEVTY
jgi:hypothetical protein